jgi:hypothetical protein
MADCTLGVKNTVGKTIHGDDVRDQEQNTQDSATRGSGPRRDRTVTGSGAL